MEPVDKELCAERHRKLDERFARDLRDIEDCKTRLKQIEELTIKMGELVEANQETLKDHKDRLAALEHRPSMWWDKLLSAGISAGVAALISAIAAMIVR